MLLMIIRRLGSSLHLITQPQHAALAARIMREWHVDHFPESPRKASILMAVEHHDDGWDDADASLVVDEASGRLLDFMEVSDTLKRETSSSGIERLASDPYAAALVAQHRLHVRNDVFTTAAEAHTLLASAPVVELKGFVGGGI